MDTSRQQDLTILQSARCEFMTTLVETRWAGAGDRPILVRSRLQWSKATGP